MASYVQVYEAFLIIFVSLLNKAHAGLWLARAWFLKIDLVRILSMCVCVPVPKAINN